jgi:hypothetical protein
MILDGWKKSYEGESEPSSILEFGNVGTLVHLRVKGLASEKQVQCKRSTLKK